MTAQRISSIPTAGTNPEKLKKGGVRAHSVLRTQSGSGRGRVARLYVQKGEDGERGETGKNQ